MKQLLILAAILGCTLSAGVEKRCNFPHKGDGGYIDKKGQYIPESVLVWVDVANNCLRFAKDEKGKEALKSWIAASNDFNIYMKRGNILKSVQAHLQADESFKDVAPYISKKELAEFFIKVHNEFKEKIYKGTPKEINEYMIKQYPQFKKKLGC